jgi:hypothetical protein
MSNSMTQAQYDAVLAMVQDLQYVNGNSSEALPSCSNSNFDSGNTAWILTSTSIVLLMTLPGSQEITAFHVPSDSIDLFLTLNPEYICPQ